MYQTTIDNAFQMEGVNVFNGKKSYATFHPRDASNGISFIVRGEEFTATLNNTINYKPARALWQANCMKTMGEKRYALKIEHALSAVYACGIDNIAIELSDGVFPRFDDGVREFASQLISNKTELSQPRMHYTVNMQVNPGDRQIAWKIDSLQVTQNSHFVVEYEVKYPKYRAIGEMKKSFTVSPDEYVRDIAPAKAIFFLPLGVRFMIDYLYPLHGIRDTNSLFVGSKKAEHYRNKEFVPRTEFVRHKILDALGALALTGTYFDKTKFTFHATGHAFDIYALKMLRAKNCFVPTL